MGVLSAVFWGVVVLSLLVFVHEGGHFLLARACGMRVKEFYLGMPCRAHLAKKSRKYGTEFGVTPILLGGYTRISGMEGKDDELLASCLAIVQREGRVSVYAISDELGCDTGRVYSMLATLDDWAAVRPYYDAEKDEDPNGSTYPDAFETVKRDANMLTEYDGRHDFTLAGTTEAGAPRPVADADAALAFERSHTYQGKNFWQRFVTLLAGPFVNILLAFVVVTLSLSLVGVEYVVDSPRLGGVVEGSLAQEAGLQPGDVIEEIDGTGIDSWTDISETLDRVLGTGRDFSLTYSRDGASTTVEIEVGGQAVDMLGIQASTETMRLSVGDAALTALAYGREVARFAVQLIIPQRTMETLSNASSVVGISAAASEAASSGANDLALFIAMVSMSLGFMNLLPIPPLDGGKILIEIIQAAIRKPLSPRVQNALSYIGLAFFLFIFIFALQNDITRIVQG